LFPRNFKERGETTGAQIRSALTTVRMLAFPPGAEEKRQRRQTMKIRSLRTALLAAGTLLLLGASANAQEYGYGYEDAAYSAPDENVTVSVPRYNPQRSPLGAPYRYISMSKGVYIGDLDLRTRRDIRVMRDRISYTARNMCHQLNVRYPITAPGSPGCYTTAMNDAMYQANIAIAQQRGDRLDRY
jgi:UrcA family protein